MFKVGDKVKCINSVGNLSYGPVYSVVSISEYRGEQFLHVLGKNVNVESGGFLSRRFVRVAHKKETVYATTNRFLQAQA